MTDTSLRQMQGGAGLAASVSAAASTTVPSPLPFVVSILPLLLSSSDVTLPPALLSPSVLQRHYYLSSTPDAPSTYLQATADSSVQDAVESRREALASTWLEDVKLSAEEDILYSRTIHEEHKLVARITLNHGIEDDIALVLLVVWEIAKTPAGDESHTDNELSDPQSRTGGENFNLFDNSDRRKDTLRGVAGQGSEDAEESSWKYYDLQLPSSKSNMNKKAWSSSISGADATLAASLTSASGSTGAASKGQQAESSTAAQQLRERRRQQQEATRGLQGEEGPDLDPEDYWAGVESSEDEMGDSADEDEAVQEDNEDSYWNSYGGGASSGDKDSIIDSGHHESELEDSTLRYNANLPQDDRAHYEYAVDAHPFASGSNHVYDYSFESERGMEDTDVPDRRILVDNFESMNRASEQNSEFANDSFLNALQSSLERVSSSQSASSDEEQDTRPNGRVNGHTNDISNNARQSNGHTANGPANGQTQYRESPTFDSAIQKSIAGIWEAFLISSASGGGGKNREIAAYEFMELVRGVVDGTAE